LSATRFFNFRFRRIIWLDRHLSSVDVERCWIRSWQQAAAPARERSAVWLSLSKAIQMRIDRFIAAMIGA